jgi:hypothetical protein
MVSFSQNVCKMIPFNQHMFIKVKISIMCDDVLNLFKMFTKSIFFCHIIWDNSWYLTF